MLFKRTKQLRCRFESQDPTAAFVSGAETLALHKKLLPQMRRRHDGRIVNMSSIGGCISVSHLLPYCSSKFALVGFFDGLRTEVLKDGIRMTTV